MLFEQETDMIISTFTKTLTVGAFCCSLALGGLAACNLESVPQALVIRGNKVPEDQCVISSSGGDNRVDGHLDLSVGRSYVAYLAVENRFKELSAISQFEDEDARLDGATVTFTAVEVVHSFPTDVLTNGGFQAKLTELKVPVPGSTVVLPASGFAAPEEVAILAADLIPPNLGQALRAFTGFTQGVDVEIMTQITAIGIRGDGSQVRSATFFYPITVCNNCLVFFDGNDELTIYGGKNLCNIGNDIGVNTVFCARYLPGSCKELRCLGEGTGADLVCPDDGQELPAPVVVP